MSAQELIREMPKGLIKWYDFKKGCEALYISAGTELDQVMAEALRECTAKTEYCTTEDLFKKETDEKYDYVLISSAVEGAGSKTGALDILKRAYLLLKENGTLLISTDNRLGIRYFCGDRDLHTGRNFDSIENYIHTKASDYDTPHGRSFSKAEITELLETAGFERHRFYSVFPLLQRPQVLFAEDYTPEEELDVRIFPQYNYPDTVFLEEEHLYGALVENNLLHIMANGFLIECSVSGELANANQITMSLERGKINAMYTIIRRDNKVEKKPVYQEGRYKINELMDNNIYLSKHGVCMVDTVLKKQSVTDGGGNTGNDAIIMPYIQEKSALEYLRELLVDDTGLFFKRLDEIWKLILSSSEHVPYSEIDWEKYYPYWKIKKSDDPAKDKWKKMADEMGEDDQEGIGVILKRGYIDLVPLNCFWDNDNFIFFDQESYIENLPAKAIMLRTIDLIYAGNYELHRQLPINGVKERYGITKCRELFYAFVGKFLNDLRNDEALKPYFRRVRTDGGKLNSNRQRINYSAEDYERIFRDIFKGAQNRDLYLFGSGTFSKHFLSQFGGSYQVAGIVDNNSEKWGTKLDGVKIFSPDILRKLDAGTFKVIICIKDYTAVMRQLNDMGINDFSVYDSSLSYPREKRISDHCLAENAGQDKKKYHVGYIAGVFDLFHVGHLNMFRRAKEQCDYLIVGVVTDEGVMNDKRTMPFVPFDERIDIVRSCRYVDEAVEIPPERSNTDEAYRRYQFDVQFSGSDYENDTGWLAKREYLRKHGSDLVFFPYTQSTSSTKLKRLIDEKLEES